MIGELLSSHCRWTDKGDNNTKYPSRSPAALRLLQAQAQLRTAAHCTNHRPLQQANGGRNQV